MMRRVLTMSLSALLLAAAPAPAQVTLGRLFSTPAERTTMEAGRGASAALAPNSQGQQPAAGTPGGPPAAPDGNQPGEPSGTGGGPGGKGADGSANAGSAPGPGAPGPGGPGPAGPGPGGANLQGSAAAKPADPPPPPAVVMSGVLRRSDNRTTVWLNDEPQYGVQKNLSQRRGATTPDVTITLPSGKKVRLKAGQRYDLNDGRVKDIDEP
jgi:hypothetical protein